MRYDSILKELLNALRKRIEDGAAVEMPGLRIGSQPPAIQRERLQDEAEAAREVSPVQLPDPIGTGVAEPPTSYGTNGYEHGGVLTIRPESEVVKDVEDSQRLALRMLERQLHLPVQQAVTINGRPVDGAIFKPGGEGGLDAIVEVKFVEFAQQLSGVKLGAKRLRTSWLADPAIAKQARLFYIVVVAKEELRAIAAKELASLTALEHVNMLPIEVKIYSLDSLRMGSSRTAGEEFREE
jgi:hypothetical protein